MNGQIPAPTFPLTTKAVVEKIPFQIAAKRLEIDENVNRARPRTH